MPLSRLRLKLAGWFALAMLLGLGALDFSLYAFLHHRALQRFDRGLSAAAGGMAAAIERELAETPDGTLERAVLEAIAEFPPVGYSFVVLDSNGRRVATKGTDDLTQLAPPFAPLPVNGPAPASRAGARVVAAGISAKPGATVVAIASTASLSEEFDTLALWLLLSAPLVALISVAAGYVLARRALAPVAAMSAGLAAMDPEDLRRRLPVERRPDELDALAQQINALLERLNQSRLRSRRFLQRAAHQLRTPLTVVRGESALALDRTRSPEEYRDLMHRVHLAAELMSRRVEELFLLARAEAGEEVLLVKGVELDGVALEAADLMRGRAQALGRHLELGRMDAVEVTADEAILREAAVELIENDCRHGDASRPIGVAVRRAPGVAELEVSSAGLPVAFAEVIHPDAANGLRDAGLGLSIVQWIARTHHGQLRHSHADGLNIFILELPHAVPNAGHAPD